MTTNSLTTLPLARLKQAVSIREQIESLEVELVQLLGEPGPVATKGPGSNHKHGARALSQQFRWSRYNGARGMQPTTVSTDSRLSPAGRAKISAVVTARWERYRAAKAKAPRVG